MTQFAELHCHTEYSNTHLIDSTNKLTAVIDHAVEMGLRGLAITDHECLSGHLKALAYAKKYKETNPDFSLILGNEIYLCHGANDYSIGENGRKYYNIESGHFYHFILLAKDAEGYHQLMKLSSRAWDRCYSYNGQERLPTFDTDIEEIIGRNPGHVIASTACIGGEFAKAVLAKDVQWSVSFTEWCVKQFGKENFYIELQPGISEEQRAFNKGAVKFCKYFGYKWIITNDCHYLTKDRRELHDTYLKSHEENRETADFYESTYFKTPVEMVERMRDDFSFEDIDIGFENTVDIAERCKDAGDYGLFHTTLIPQRELPPFEVGDGFAPFYDICPSLKYCATSPYEQDRFCLAECERGARAKGIPFTEALARRIDIELKHVLSISEQLGQRMTSYYNLVQYIVQLAWEVSYVGNGRGSACGFMLCYLMDITQVDSMKWNLPWWRHVHETKIELADIDEDFSPLKRPVIFEKIREVFGEDRCLNIITFRHESTKAAIITACRGLGINADQAQELSSLVPITRGKVYTLNECVNGTEDNGFQPVTELVNKLHSYPNLYETVEEIEGLVSGRGIHASGFLITQEAYIKQIALMRAPNGSTESCWDLEDCEEAGCLKVDLLVTDAQQKMQTCMDLLLEDGVIEDKGSLKANYDAYLHPDVINYDNPEMWRQMQDGEIKDLFQFDTAMGSEAIAKLRPRTLKEISLANSAMRLMSNEEFSPIDHFAACKNDINVWYKEMQDAGLNQEEVSILEKYLLPNYGCSIEQEDMMELVMDKKIANFDMKQANKLRKGVAKKKKSLIEECKKMFFEQGKAIGTRNEMLNYVWKYGITPQLG